MTEPRALGKHYGKFNNIIVSVLEIEMYRNATGTS